MNIPIIAPAIALAYSEMIGRQGVAAPIIYFWAAPETSVVVGLAQAAEREVFAENLRADNVKLYRRQSGGGAVVLTPGGLCFEVLAPAPDGALPDIHQTFRDLTAPIRRALSAWLGREVTLSGISDLTVNLDGGAAPQKIGGTAQRRQRHAVLVHGTILVNVELTLLSRYLAFPGAVPDYRRGRRHEDFCTTLATITGDKNLTPTAVAEIIAAETARAGWRRITPALNEHGAPVGRDADETAAFAELRRRKYDNDKWNWRRERN